jgi:hypothetical protein
MDHAQYQGYRIGREVAKLWRQPSLATYTDFSIKVFAAVLTGLKYAFYGVLAVVALIIVMAMFESAPRVKKEVASKYDAWKEDRWVTECAKYSELPDCRRRYHQLERGD